MMSYIYNFYLNRGISSAMVAAIVSALISTIVIFGAIMLKRALVISREIKSLQNNGMSETEWNTSVNGLIKKHQIKYLPMLIVVTYAAMLLFSYLLFTKL
jgi:H+/Cl- antiporter ClcA